MTVAATAPTQQGPAPVNRDPANGWRQLSTAPRNGRPILLLISIWSTKVVCARYSSALGTFIIEGTESSECLTAALWHPVPPLPSEGDD